MVKLLDFLYRLWFWVPVIWNDVDYDYSSILKILQFKAERHAAHQKRHRLIAHWSHVVTACDNFRHLIELYFEDPDDEWTTWVNTHSVNEMTFVGRQKALALSTKRQQRNWHNIWTYLDTHLENWWD